MYIKFLKSPYWQQCRKAVIARDKRCVKCGAKKRLQVHHKTYLHHRDELNHLGDLELLCRSCHRRVHSLKR